MLVTDWDAEDVAAALPGKSRRRGEHWEACCPAHDDKKPSLRLTNGSDGQLLFHCLGNCSSDEVFWALKRELDGKGGSHAQPAKPKAKAAKEDPWEPVIPVPPAASIQRPENFHHFEFGLPSKIWTYRTAEGEVFGWVCRYEEKDGGKQVMPWMWMKHKSGKSELRSKGFPDPRPLYQLDRIIAEPSKPIFYVEGEKTADAAQKLFPDWTATTHPGGSTVWHKADLRPLKHRIVITGPDHDGPGYKMIHGLLQLQQLPVSQIRILRFPTHARPVDGRLVSEPYHLESGADAHDFLQDGWTRDLIKQAMESAPHMLAEPLEGLDTPFEPIAYAD